MSEGRYVRRYHNGEDSEEEDYETSERSEVGRFVRAPVSGESDAECGDQNEVDLTNNQLRIEIDPRHENSILKKQVADM